jgi:hypothetical protein
MHSMVPHETIEREGWDYVARALITFPIDIPMDAEPENLKLVRLRKELQVMKHALYEELMTFNGNRSVDASFLIGTTKAVARIEAGLEAEGIKNLGFVLLLKLLLRRLRKQRLVVKKPMETRGEFGRMKRVVEHAGSL